jgi:hypothetical protein
MDWFEYKTSWSEEGAKQPSVRIDALAARYDLRRGEFPDLRMPDAESYLAWFGRNPFKPEKVAGVSPNLVMDPRGTLDGHNLIYDGNILDALRLDNGVPISPLFVRDLAGRVIYTGYGPERKTNFEWAQYPAQTNADGMIAESDINIFIPLCVFPLNCRDVAKMAGEHLLEQVFLTKFRCVEMSLGFYGLRSTGEEDNDLVAITYAGANLYPYKLRPDTFYIDGWKLPQTQMLYARGEESGVDAVRAVELGDKFLEDWKGREAGVTYEDWLEKQYGKHEMERLYENGCTIIPTFEACNGYNVVSREFELADYWPGRAVLGLHDVVERRADKAPEGTILQVLTPGYVTAHIVVPAQVVVSDGSGYVSPNAMDNIPFLPNLALPHQRMIANWQACWIPTHPAHFEAPAIWGWEPRTGRFLQLSGPLWDPLHYYYASVDEILVAYEQPLEQDKNRWLVPVPEHMHNRFYPVVPMSGFDTMSAKEMQRRKDEKLLPRSSLKRVERETVTAGLVYHPLPAEFEFELDSFWFPDFLPANRSEGPCPPDLLEQLIPMLTPRVSVKSYAMSIDAPEDAPWLTDEAMLIEPAPEAIENYPHLTRYVAEEMEIEEIIKIAPVLYLGDMSDLLEKPTEQWWVDADDKPLDSTAAIAQLANGVRESLWMMRLQGADWVRFRHLLYQTNLPAYTFAWWNCTSLSGLLQMFDTLTSDEPVDGNQPLAAEKATVNRNAQTLAQQGVAVDES